MGGHDNNKRRSSAIAIQQIVRKSQKKKQVTATANEMKRRSSVVKIQATMRKMSSKKELEKRKAEKRKTKKEVRSTQQEKVNTRDYRAVRTQTNIKICRQSNTPGGKQLTPRREKKNTEFKRRGSALLIQKAYKKHSGRKNTKLSQVKGSKIAVDGTNEAGSPKMSQKGSQSSPKNKYILETGFSTKKTISEAPPKESCMGMGGGGGPNQILRNLWLGNREDAMDFDKLKVRVKFQSARE